MKHKTRQNIMSSITDSLAKALTKNPQIKDLKRKLNDAIFEREKALVRCDIHSEMLQAQRNLLIRMEQGQKELQDKFIKCGIKVADLQTHYNNLILSETELNGNNQLKPEQQMVKTRTNKRNNTNAGILALDPSLTAWGFSVIDWNGVVVEVGCIKTKSLKKKTKARSGDDLVRRLREIIHTHRDLIYKYNIRVIVAELPHGSRNDMGAAMLGGVPGILETIQALTKIALEWYSENDVKKFLFNRSDVSKLEMRNYVKSKLDVPWPVQEKKEEFVEIKSDCEAIADSLGVYLTAREQSAAIKLLSNQK